MRIPSLLLCLCVPLVAGCADLIVKSNPPGAQVYIDDQPTGFRTPAALSPQDIAALPDGKHRITVKLEGHYTPDAKEFEKSLNFRDLSRSLFVPLPYAWYHIIKGYHTTDPREFSFTLREK